MEDKYCVSSELLKKLDDAIKDIGNLNPWQHIYDISRKNLPRMEIKEMKDEQGNVYAFYGKFVKD